MITGLGDVFNSHWPETPDQNSRDITLQNLQCLEYMYAIDVHILVFTEHQMFGDTVHPNMYNVIFFSHYTY